MQSIKELMLIDHAKINEMLKDLEKSSKEEALDKFNIFKWQLEKHFFAEEKAIFGVMDKINTDESDAIFDLMQEHGKIIGLVKELERKVDEGQEVNVSELKASVEAHSEFENDVFYPKLDEALTDNQKTEIIERAKEIIRG